MIKTKLSPRDTFMVIILCILLVGVIYYMTFYSPLQEELASVASQTTTVDEQIQEALQKVSSMNDIQKNLDAILARPKEQISEFMPFDNKEALMNRLYAILSVTDDYSLSFADPDISEEDGSVRRDVTATFSCPSYDTAKAIIYDLSHGSWRCLVSTCAVSSVTDDHDYNSTEISTEVPEFSSMLSGNVRVSLSLTFFESTLLP